MDKLNLTFDNGRFTVIVDKDDKLFIWDRESVHPISTKDFICRLINVLPTKENILAFFNEQNPALKGVFTIDGKGPTWKRNAVIEAFSKTFI